MALAVRSARRRDRRGPLSSMGISKIQTETLTQAQKEAPRRSGADARFKLFVFYGHHPVVPAAGERASLASGLLHGQSRRHRFP